MSQQLVQRLQQAKYRALAQGQIIKLRKQDVTKHHLVGNTAVKFSYTWYQTPAKVGIEIPFVVQNRDDLKVKFDDDRVIIDFPTHQGQNYHLDLTLYSKIIPPKCKKNHRLNSIQIVMQKADATQSWPFLRRDGLGIPQAQEGQKIIYPTSSKNKKDWDKIDRQIEGDMLKHGEQFGQDPGMNFFKQIFKNADQQKRKAMIKSFQTSGGTVLSTDWNDVSKKDYEGKDRPSPPKGQQWKKRQL